MRIGELAARVGLRTSALRYYESKGLLAPAGRISGRRVYDRQSLNTLRLLLATQHAGFTLAEARTVLSLLPERGRGSKRWQEMARGKLEELDASIEQLQGARGSLAVAIDCACAGDADACDLVARVEPRGGVRRSRNRQGRR